MKVLVVFDSQFGNTEKIARTIGNSITGEVKVVRAGDTNPADLKGLDLLIVGSPTQGGRPTKPVQEFLSKISSSGFKTFKVAAFDTRVRAKWVVIFGFAAGKIANSLKKIEGTSTVPPQGFFVKSTRGPLLNGELERAADWAKKIVNTKT